jgi:uncharacterized protein (TIGR03435 family)
MRMIGLCLWCALAVAQTGSVVKHEVAAESRAEVAAALRAILDRGSTVDEQANGVEIHSNAISAAVAELFFEKLDARQFGEFAVPDAADVKLAILSTPDVTTETTNLLRSIGNLQFATPLPKAQAIVLRGREESVALAQWVLPRLQHRPETGEERISATVDHGRTDEVCLFFPTGTASLEEFRFAVMAMTDTPLVLVHHSPDVIVMRGEPARVALGAWLFQRLNNPPSGIQPTVHMYRLEGVDDNLVRIFFVQGEKSADDLRALGGAVHTASRVVRLRVVPTIGAIVLRGNAEQIAVAARTVNGDAAPAFEVASVKPSAKEAMPNGTQRADGIDSQDQTLRSYIARAYGLSSYQVSGPAWLDTERFDISAKASSAISEQQRKAMLQSLLAERFHLAAHKETQSLNGYALVAARGGVKVQPVERSPTPPPQRAVSNHMLSLKENTFHELAQRLEWILACPIEDATGVNGVFSFDLRWTPDAIQSATRRLPVPVSADAPGPSLFEILEDKVGMKLEKRKISTEVLVVDHVDRVPAGN